MKKILVLNGPNLNFLGIREPDIYGKQTYADLCLLITNYAKEKNIEIEIYQSNHEGDLIDKLQQAYFEHVDGIVFNPGAYTHTSIALYDALKAIQIACVEVHLSDIDSREEFRKVSMISKACILTIKGEGFNGYLHAINTLIESFYGRNH